MVKTTRFTLFSCLAMALAGCVTHSAPRADQQGDVDLRTISAEQDDAVCDKVFPPGEDNERCFRRLRQTDPFREDRSIRDQLADNQLTDGSFDGWVNTGGAPD